VKYRKGTEEMTDPVTQDRNTIQVIHPNRSVKQVLRIGDPSMSTFNALYIRKKASDKSTRSAILTLYPKAEIETFPDFIGGILSSEDSEPPEKKLSAISEKLLTDVIWLGYQTTAGSFIYHHWNGGSHLRALSYGCIKTGKWDRVEGEAEEWEQECFWDEESLEMNLEEAKSDVQRKKLKKLWSAGVLIEGNELPVAGDDTAADTIMEHYGFGY
jgi:hypothetical protein